VKHARSTLAFWRIRFRPTTGCPDAPSHYTSGPIFAGGSCPSAICLSHGSCGSLSVATASGLLLL